MNIGRLTAFIFSRRLIRLWWIATAFAALAAPSAHAIRTPIDTSLSAISEPLVAVAEPAPAETWFIEAVYPVGQADDGDFIDLAVLVAPQTHTRVWCYVKSPLGLTDQNAVSLNLTYTFSDQSSVALDLQYRSANACSDPYSVIENIATTPAPPPPPPPPAFVAYDPKKAAPVYRKEPVIARYHSYEWVGPAGRFYSAKDVPGFALFDTDTRAPKGSSWVDVQMYKASLHRELRTGEAERYESNVGLYYIGNALLWIEGAHSLKSLISTRSLAQKTLKGAAAEAAATQGTRSYPGVDVWANAFREKGTVVYQLAGKNLKVGNYFTTAEAVAASGYESKLLTEAVQVEVMARWGYRRGVRMFILNEGIPTAESAVLANPRWGAGGAWQIYIQSKYLNLLDEAVGIPLKVP